MTVPHYIRENKAVIVPNRFICLGTDANSERTPAGGEVRTWRLAVTSYDHRRTATQKWYPVEWEHHSTPEGLWAYVDSKVRQHGRTIVFAHDMGKDIRISQALTVLPALGWRVERWQVNDRGCVVRLRDQVRSLWLVDSANWLPFGLDKVGGLLSISRPFLPAECGSGERGGNRCESGVVILRAAVVDLLAWVEEDQLGNWQPTAGSMAWAEWRHRHYTHKVLVHDNVEAREAERAAAWTGRCEAWRWGRLPGGRWYEYDMPLCYARVAQSCNLPGLLQWHVTKPALRTVLRCNGKDVYLARATVVQDYPLLPQRLETGVRWPAGTVTGWYWDVELQLANRWGATIEVHEGWRYYGTPLLKAWADWIIPFVEDRSPDCSPLRQAVAKIWARALIGRFATRYCTYDKMGEAIDAEVGIEDLYDVDTGDLGKLLQVGGEAFAGMRMCDGTETAPAVMSFVMAEARCRIWQLMWSAGLEHVAYVDTDGLIVDATGASLLGQYIADGHGWGVRQKSRHDSLVVHGPRQLSTGGVARMAGLPRGAEMVGPGQWVAQVSESLQESVSAGRPTSVVVSPRTWTAGTADNRRLHLPGGITSDFVSA